MRGFFTLFFFGIFFHKVSAQKALEVQNSYLKAPTQVRIDGKLNEWSSPLVAENKRTEIFYTLASDEKQVYLAVKATSSASIAKIMAGGISFAVNPKGKKKEEGAAVVTYPVIARSIGQTSQNRQRNNQTRSERSQEQRDSATLVQRKSQLAAVKEIKIGGFEQITDSLISIYNEYGIKAKALIDDKGAYCFELAIPFSQLGISLAENKEIVYQIKLNGRAVVNNAAIRNGGGTFSGGNNRGGMRNANNMAQQDLSSPTDFWGKYPLQ